LVGYLYRMDMVLKYIADTTFQNSPDGEAATFIWDSEVVIIRYTQKLETKYVIISSNSQRVEEQAIIYLEDKFKLEVSDLERY